MAGITLTQAETKLTEYLSAESAVLTGQSYSIAGRALTRANLGEIRDGIKYWNDKISELSINRTGIKIRGGTPSYDR